MFIAQLLFSYSFIIVVFCFSSMDECLKDLNCRKEIDKTYGKRLKTVTMTYYPDLLKEINSVPNLIISSDTLSYLFSAIAVDHLIRTITPECKATIKPHTYFPFSYVYQGETEAQGKNLNMNCFFVEYEQYNIIQKCISSDYFNIYSINNRGIPFYWTERKCKYIRLIQRKCWDEQHSRIDTVQDRNICYKQTNTVYDKIVEIAKMDLMSQNGGKVVDNLFLELPAEGTYFLKTCIPNCYSCFSYEKCNQCKPQYSLVKNKCIKCFETCESCSLENNSSGCLTCKEKLALYENQCLEQCPDGFFNQNRVCIRCAEGCKKCYKNPSYCIECQNEFVLQDEKCQKKCNDRFYSNIGQCQNCTLGCKECSSDQNCLQCENEFIKRNEKECVVKCKNITNCEICENEICLKCIESKILIQYLEGKTVCDDKCPKDFQKKEQICHEIQSNLEYYLIIIFLIILAISFFIYFYIKKRQNQTNNKQIIQNNINRCANSESSTSIQNSQNQINDEQIQHTNNIDTQSKFDSSIPIQNCQNQINNEQIFNQNNIDRVSIPMLPIVIQSSQNQINNEQIKSLNNLEIQSNSEFSISIQDGSNQTNIEQMYNLNNDSVSPISNAPRSDSSIFSKTQLNLFKDLQLRVKN